MFYLVVGVAGSLVALFIYIFLWIKTRKSRLELQQAQQRYEQAKKAHEVAEQEYEQAKQEHEKTTRVLDFVREVVDNNIQAMSWLEKNSQSYCNSPELILQNQEIVAFIERDKELQSKILSLDSPLKLELENLESFIFRIVLVWSQISHGADKPF